MGTVGKLLTGLGIFLCAVTPLRADDSPAKKPIEIHIVTQAFAPLQYLKNGRPEGYVVDFIDATIDRVNEQHPITVASYDFLPWKRAMVLAEREPNTLFFSLSRTPQREAKFHWLGTVSPYRQLLFKLKKNEKITAENLADLKDSTFRPAVQRGSNLEALLLKNGFEREKDFTLYTDYHQGVKMLFAGRIDMLPLTGFLARSTVCRMGYDGDAIEAVLPIDELAKPLWAVFSRETPPTLVAAFQQTMRDLQEEGLQDAAISRHLDAWQKQPCEKAS